LFLGFFWGIFHDWSKKNWWNIIKHDVMVRRDEFEWVSTSVVGWLLELRGRVGYVFGWFSSWKFEGIRYHHWWYLDWLKPHNKFFTWVRELTFWESPSYFIFFQNSKIWNPTQGIKKTHNVRFSTTKDLGFGA
jgi:hypothetical protein